MKVLASTMLLAAGASAFAPAKQCKISPAMSMSEEAVAEPAPAATDSLGDLKDMAQKLNPLVCYYDPLKLASGELDIYDQGKDATIAFLRQAEIKHGRVAMAAFVGYCVQSNWHWPWAMTTAGESFPSVDLSPEQQWDAIPAVARYQIILVIGFFEGWSEASGNISDEPHYMRGGQPGKFPSFQTFRDEIHWTLDLYDPFGYSKKMSQEKKDERLLMEINNGRLAMLGIFGFLCADTIPGSVPLLKDIAIPYDGQVMSPFEAGY